MADIMDQTPLTSTDVASQNIDPRLIRMFQKPEGQVGVQGTFTHFVQPLRPPTADDTDYVMELPNTGSDYIDLKNMQLYVRGSLKRATGVDLIVDEPVVLANNALHSLFESVTVFVGHNQQEIQMNNYPYKAYLRQLMTMKSAASPASIGHGFVVENRNLAKGAMGSGLARKGWTALSKVFELLGPTFIDFFQTEGYLLPATPVRVVFRRSRDSLYVNTGADNAETQFKFFIEKIGLYVPVVKIAPFLTPLMEMQTDEAPASYHFEAIDVRQFSLPKGTLHRVYPRVFQGKLPTKMAVAFYTQDSFIGDRNQPSLMTATIFPKRLQLAINGLVTREHSIDVTDGAYMESYFRFTDWLGVTNIDYPISFKSYPKSSMFLTFDLMENCVANAGSLSCGAESLLTGFADIAVEFDDAVDEESIMVVYALSPDVVDISKERAARFTRVIT